MKNLFTFFIILFVVFSALAQTPQGINYQAVIRDASGNILTSQNVGILINIRIGSIGGTISYAETHNAITNMYGLVNLVIGQGNAQTGTFATISWGSNSHFVEIQADITGGTNYQTIGTQQLMSVPYALYAEKTGQSYMAGVGIGISGNTISNTSPDQAVIMNGSGGTTISGTYPNFTINSPSPITYTSGIGIGVAGNIISNTSPDQIVLMTGTGGTTISGTYPNFTISSPSPTTYTAGTGIGISGNTITNTAPNQAVSLAGTGGTTVAGAYPNFTINSLSPTTYTAGTGIGISGNTITNTAPNQVVSLAGTGGTTIAGTYPNFTINSSNPTTYTAGTGIGISGNTITNTAPNQAVSLAGTGGTTIVGTYPNFTINSVSPTTYTAGTGIGISGNTITNTAPNQVVSLAGTGGTTIAGTYPNFTINSPNPTIYTAGAGISISGNTITNTSLNQNQTLSISGSSLSISNGNSVSLPNINGSIGMSYQQLPMLEYNGNGVTFNSICSDPDGNRVYIIYDSGNGNPGTMISVFKRDMTTGQYYVYVQKQLGPGNSSPVMIGQYLYFISLGYSNIVRVDTSIILGGGAINFSVMNLVGSSFSGTNNLATDGNDLLIYNQISSSWVKHTISGNSLINAGVVLGAIPPDAKHIYDGTKMFTYSSGTVQRWTNPNTLDFSFQRLLSNNLNTYAYLVNGGTDFIYVAYQPTGTSFVSFFPISKQP